VNGRIHDEETPEGRIAAVAVSLVLKMQDAHYKTGVGPQSPDYADYRDAFRLHMERELLLARIDEARKTAATALTARMKELSDRFVECELQISKEKRP
jgi:hypothetical protein